MTPGLCGKCHHPLRKGDPYLWWKGRYTPKYVRCTKPTCSPRPWELETNATKATAWEGEWNCSQASEAEDAATAAGFLREAITMAESVKEDLDERIGNKEGTALEQTSEYEALTGSREAFEGWLSDAESACDDLEAVEEVSEEAVEDDQVSYEEALQGLLGNIPDWPELDLGVYGPPPPKKKPAAVVAEPAETAGEDIDGDD